MTSQLRSALAVACLGLLTAACEGPIEERYAEAICSKNFECCEASQIPEGTSEEDCRDGLEVGIASMISEAESDDAEGRVDYSEKNLEACVDAIESASCGSWPAVAEEPPCSTVVVGKIEVGGACDEDSECGSGECDSTLMTCEATVAESGDCSDFNVSCAPDLYCDATSVCIPKKAAAELCASFDECLSDTCELASAEAVERTCAEAACYQGCSTTRSTSAVVALIGALLVWRRRGRRAR